MQRPVEHLEIDFKAELGSKTEALRIVANENASGCQPTVGRAADHGLHVNDGQGCQEAIGGVVQNAAHRVVGAAHDALHTVHRAEIVAAIDAFPAARSHQNVFVVIRHADDFMRHDLADGENQIEAALKDQPVDLCRPGKMQLPFRLLFNKSRGHFADGLNVRPPVVNMEQRLWHIAKHAIELRGRHSRVRAESGQNRRQPIAVVFPRVASQLAGARMEPRDVGWDDQHTAPFAQLVERLEKLRLQFRAGNLRRRIASRHKEAHTGSCTFFNPGASVTIISSASK